MSTELKLSHMVAVGLVLSAYPVMAQMSGVGGSAGGSATGSAGVTAGGNVGSPTATTPSTIAPGSGITVKSTVPNVGVSVNPGMNANVDTETNYWHDNFVSRPYYSKDRDYQAYAPAYRYGVNTYRDNKGRPYSELDQERLRRGWEQARGTSRLSWNDAQLAARDSYNRLYEASNIGATNNTTLTTTTKAMP
jgi:hypothetical protein